MLDKSNGSKKMIYTLRAITLYCTDKKNSWYGWEYRINITDRHWNVGPSKISIRGSDRSMKARINRRSRILLSSRRLAGESEVRVGLNATTYGGNILRHCWLHWGYRADGSRWGAGGTVKRLLGTTERRFWGMIGEWTVEAARRIIVRGWLIKVGRWMLVEILVFELTIPLEDFFSVLLLIIHHPVSLPTSGRFSWPTSRRSPIFLRKVVIF